MDYLLRSTATLENLEHVNSLSILQYLREIKEKIKWCLDNNNHLQFLGISSFEQSNIDEIHRRGFHNFKVLLQRAILLEIDNEEIDKTFRFVQNYLKKLKEIVVTEVASKKLKAYLENAGNLDDEELVLLEEDSDENEEKENLTKFQKIYEFALDKMKSYNWRSMGDNVCQMVYVYEVQTINGDFFWLKHDKINNDVHTILRRFPAYYYEKVCSIEDVISRKFAVDWQNDRESWLKFTERSNTPDEIVRNLKRFDEDSRFPAVQICHRSRSFLNGILFFHKKGVKFFRYSQSDLINKEFSNLGVRSHGSSPLLIEKEFDETVLFYENPADIPTPCFESILTHQRFKKQTLEVIYALLGRAFVPLRTFDKWQVIPMIKGVAESGKSTIGYILQKCFADDDVGTMSSNHEEKFGLEPIADKQIWVCLEVSPNFGLEKTEFQSMVTGENVSIKKKGKKAEKVTWKAPGWLFGNYFMAYKDKEGAIARRIVVILFNEPPTTNDTDLDRKILNELPNLIIKFYNSYIRLLDRHGQSSFWDFCPEYFRKTRRHLEGKSNALKEFLRSTAFMRGWDKYMLVTQFQKLFKDEYGHKPDKNEIKSACGREKKYVKYIKKASKMNPETNRVEVSSWLVGIAPSVGNSYKYEHSDDDDVQDFSEEDEDSGKTEDDAGEEEDEDEYEEV